MRLSASWRAVSITIGTARGLADEAGEIEAGLAGHHDVEDEQIEMQAGELGARVARAHRGGDAIALAAEEARQQIADAAVVVDQQEMRGVVGRLQRAARSVAARSGTVIPLRWRC